MIRLIFLRVWMADCDFIIELAIDTESIIAVEADPAFKGARFLLADGVVDWPELPLKFLT